MALEIVEIKRPKEPMTIRRSVVIATISLIIGAVVFYVAYIGMKQSAGIGVYNQPISSWMTDHRSPTITTVAKVITNTASPIILASIVFGLSIIWAIKKKEAWRPLLLVGATGVAAVVSTLLKNTIMNTRPPQINMVPAFETDFSFPSGHTIGTIVFLLVLGYLIYSRRYSMPRFWAWTLTALTGTAVIAASRLYLGYHWLTDVIASVGLGLVILALVILIDQIVIRRLSKSD